MSKVEKFIQDYTKNCSNAQGGWVNGEYNTVFRPWLTPEQARRAVEIARQEVIEKAAKWLLINAPTYHWYDPLEGEEGVNWADMVSGFKKAMTKEE